MNLKPFKENNKKSKGIFIFTIASIFLLAFVYFASSFAVFEDIKDFTLINGNIPDPGDIILIYHSEDGSITNQVPSKNSNMVLDKSKSHCTNGVKLSWNNIEWKATLDHSEFNNTTGQRTKCDLWFREEKIADQITKLAGNADTKSIENIYGETVYDTDGTTVLCQNTLAYDHFQNLRYVDGNPCNYVSFNDELWRIIGVFEDNVKLVRNDSIGGYSWDTDKKGQGINQWGESEFIDDYVNSGTTYHTKGEKYTGADLMKLLNPGYEDYKEEVYNLGTFSEKVLVNNSLYWNRESGTCYTGYKNSSQDCDFSSTGMKNEFKKFIDKHLWNTGDSDYSELEAQQSYLNERRETIEKDYTDSYSDKLLRTATWEGYIGLIYSSDYRYALGGVNRIYSINANSSNYCQYNWMCKSSHEWTLTPHFNDDSGSLTASDSLSYSQCYNNAALVYPSLYLKSNVRILSGNGSSTNPYQIELVGEE